MAFLRFLSSDEPTLLRNAPFRLVPDSVNSNKLRAQQTTRTSRHAAARD